MNTDLQIFKKDNLNLRTILIGGEPWFVLKDLCEALDISNITTLTERLNPRGLGKTYIPHPQSEGKEIEVLIINESNLYKTILRSNKPEALQFEDWITSEVLPTIRKTGKYEVDRFLPSYQIENAVKRAERWIEEYKEKEALQLQLESQKDKVEFAEQLLDTTNALDFKTAAKAMNLGYGRNTLFIKCRELGILDRSNQPYQKHIDSGYFIILESFFNHPKTGDKILTTKTLITAKGQQFLLKKLNCELVT